MKHVPVLILVTILTYAIAAAITPPDPMTMLIYWIPCLTTALVSYGLGVRNGRKDANRIPPD